MISKGNAPNSIAPPRPLYKVLSPIDKRYTAEAA